MPMGCSRMLLLHALTRRATASVPRHRPATALWRSAFSSGDRVTGQPGERHHVLGGRRTFAVTATSRREAVGASPPSTPPTVESLAALTVVELKVILRREQLPVSGTKAVLVDRLLTRAALPAAAPAAAVPAAAPPLATAAAAEEPPPPDDVSSSAVGGSAASDAVTPVGRAAHKGGRQRGERTFAPPVDGIAALPAGETCPGCGVRMQASDPTHAGFYTHPAPRHPGPPVVTPTAEELATLRATAHPGERPTPPSCVESRVLLPPTSPPSADDDYAAQLARFEAALFDDGDSGGGGRPGAGARAPGAPPARKQRLYSGPAPDHRSPASPLVVCARCHALRHSGRVKAPGAEASLPAFDFEAAVGRRIAAGAGRRATVLLLVDVADFDGSFPRQAAMVLCAGSGQGTPQLVLAATKADLLPASARAPRLLAWIRRRSRSAGLTSPLAAAHLVSSLTSEGVPELASDLSRLAGGVGGDVWVVGAQNAGKSSLINALRRHAGSDRGRDVTAAALPGTTVGIVALGDVLPNGARVMDTPGLLHTHQLTTVVGPEDLKLLLPRRPLRPRTWLARAGSALCLGAVGRVEVIAGDRVLLTLWASADVVAHFGRADAAEDLTARHAGGRLRPPGTAEGASALGPLLPRDVTVDGGSLKASSTDIAFAGLGWVGVAVAGTASLRVSAPAGVAVTVRDTLLPDVDDEWQRPGFQGTAAP